MAEKPEFILPKLEIPLNNGDILTVRKAVDTDAVAVAGLLRGGKRRKEEIYGDFVWGLRDFTEKWARREIAEGATYVGDINETTVSTFGLTNAPDSVWGDLRPQNALSLHKATTAENVKGENIAKTGVEAIALAAGRQGIEYLCMDIPRSNATLERFYTEQLGFERPPISEVDWLRPDPDNTLPEDKKIYHARLLWRRLTTQEAEI